MLRPDPPKLEVVLLGQAGQIFSLDPNFFYLRFASAWGLTHPKRSSFLPTEGRDSHVCQSLNLLVFGPEAWASDSREREMDGWMDG